MKVSIRLTRKRARIKTLSCFISCYLAGARRRAKLADEIYQKFSQNIAITYSLAGVTENPTLPKHIEKFTYHRHGFGGYQGFVNFLETREVDIIINATHPFTTKINETAAKASCPEKHCLCPLYPSPHGIKMILRETDDACPRQTGLRLIMMPKSINGLINGSKKTRQSIKQRQIFFSILVKNLCLIFLPIKIARKIPIIITSLGA